MKPFGTHKELWREKMTQVAERADEMKHERKHWKRYSTTGNARKTCLHSTLLGTIDALELLIAFQPALNSLWLNVSCYIIDQGIYEFPCTNHCTLFVIWMSSEYFLDLHLGFSCNCLVNSPRSLRLHFSCSYSACPDSITTLRSLGTGVSIACCRVHNEQHFID
jgi:hypothetical protein